jgi:DNA polymerase epsilon subunit 1
MRLISEFKRLGATVVFADFRRIIISTDKHDLASATDYVSYITDTITSHSVFEYIRIEPTK